jgi:hypothetical protein
MTPPEQKDDDRLTEDDRFRNSKTSTINPMHAVMRCVSEFGGAVVDNSKIVKAFFDAGSSRVWDADELNEALAEGVEKGFLDKIERVGYRLTETGRNEIGPMLEMELKYV